MRLQALTILLCSFSCFAQPRLDKSYTRKHYTTYDGLVQSQINRIVQDSKGYLWICTKGGLSRFDGAGFHNFVDLSDGERINIQNIVETKNGFIANSVTKIWRFTYEEENPENWKFEDIKIPGEYLFYCQANYFLNESDSSLYIFNAIKDDSKPGQYLHFRYDLKTNSQKPLPLENKLILLSYADKTTRYYLSTDHIYLFRDGVFLDKRLPAQFDNYVLNPSDSSLYGYNKQAKTIFRFDNNFGSITPVLKDILLDLTTQAEPNTFIINKTGRFIYIDKKRHVYILNNSQPEMITSISSARCLFTGREKNLWVGSEEGLFNLFQFDFKSYTFNITESIDNVWSLACAPDGTMWFGGYNNGVWSMNKNGKINIYSSKDFNIRTDDSTLFKLIYMGCIRDSEGRIYMPSSLGMLIIDRNSLKYKNTGSIPMSITDDAPHNRLILGKVTGFQIMEKGTWNNILDIHTSHNIVSTSINRDGKIIAGSFRKQFMLEEDSLKPFSSESNTGIISMAKDFRGNIWKGTPLGLYLDNGNTETQILDEIIQGSVMSVFIKHPWLLAATVKEMYIINIDSFYKANSAYAYKFNSSDGYFSMDGGQNGFCQDNEGKIWYTVTDKVLCFSPDSLVHHYNDYLPEPHFASVSFSKNAIDWLRYAPDDTAHFIWNHNFRSIRFSMQVIPEAKQKDILYQYRLLGMSDVWSQSSQITQQTFTNLHPGSYRIEIRSSPDGEHWSEPVTSHRLIIKSAWWQKWWSYMIEFLILVSIVARITTIITKKRQKQMIYKLTEQKRLNELQLQSVRSKNIPHFSGNVLANIEHFIFNADLQEANKFLTKYSRLINITLRDADKAGRPIVEELEYVKLYLDLEKMRFGDHLEYSIVIDPSVDQSKELPNMLMQTWVENAIKHGIRHKEGPGRILVTVASTGPDAISVNVEDNGIGRAKAKEYGTTGTGEGLRILSEQVAIYNQINVSKILLHTTDLFAEDGTAAGTCFEMIIPMIYSFDF